MSFKNKFNILLETLKISNKEIAEITKLDTSLISRYRTGNRIPAKNSINVQKIANAFTSVSSVKNMEDLLLKKTHTTNIYAYLNDELIDKTECSKDKNLAFSKNLTKLMSVLNVNNNSLALKLSIDPSLVSRYKNGTRNPVYNTDIAKFMCIYFANLTILNSKKTEVNKLVKMNILDLREDELAIVIYNYLFNDNTIPKEINKAREFLETLEKLEIDTDTNTNTNNIDKILSNDVFKDNQNLYFGEEGLRKATVRFLGNTIKSNKEKQIYLFSNQTMEWLENSKSFSKVWSILMKYSILNKNKIKIIHSLNRSTPELFVAIEKWLPLYLTGLVDSSYSLAVDELFSRTIFINGTQEALYGSTANGSEENAIYHYSKNKEEIKILLKQFNKIEQSASILVSSYSSFDKYYEIMKNNNEVTSLLTGLSFNTMNKNLLIRILKRNHIKNTDKILEVYDTLNVRKSSLVKEHIYISEYSENIKVNFPIYLVDKDVYYTKEEYSEHLQDIENLRKSNNYSISKLTHKPYNNLEIFVLNDKYAIVIKVDKPHIVFCFEHFSLVKVFKKYIESFDNNKL